MKSTFSKKRLKHKVATSLMVLATRRVILQIILTTSNIVLARLFLPEVFGIFAIITFLTVLFGFLTNFGLGPALVQKKESISKKELRTMFTLLLCATSIVIAIIWVVAPVLDVLYQGKLGNEGVFWLRLFSFTLLLDNCAVISLQLLERNLEFTTRALGEIVTITATQLIIIILALKGFGIGAFVLGVLAGKCIQFVIFFSLKPWPIGINFTFNHLKKLLSFGLNYQANSLVGALNAAVVPGFVGVIVGPQAVGLVSWAGGIRQAALAPTDVIEKILFTAASRVQDNQEILKGLIERMLRLSCMTAFPLLALVAALAPQLIHIIFTDKWLPGLLALYLSLIQGVFLLFGVLSTDVLMALGEVKTVRNITFFWVILQWILTVPLVLVWNFNGVVVAGLIVSTTFFIPLSRLKNKVHFEVMSNSILYLVLAGISGIMTWFMSTRMVINSIGTLILAGSVGLALYCILLFSLQGTTLKKDLQLLKTLLVSR